ncbi:MAG: hypothetical protein CK424_06220 [Legionella sp.]|nr:MAG: hypothetical protein CK424_06220 [Legionella sp.]
MTNLAIKQHVVESLVASRKMLPDQIIRDYEVKNGDVIFKNFTELKHLSDKLAVPVKDFFVENDLDDGIKISRKNDSFHRVSEKGGVKYYTYNHLATTKTEPNLMALRVDLHCKDIDKITLNDGHDSKELVYVTKGKVRMDWKTDNGVRNVELNVGDSAYVSPNVPHSFMAMEDNSELIAVNY